MHHMRSLYSHVPFALCTFRGLLGWPCSAPAESHSLARKIHDCRNTKGLAMVQIRCLGGFETKNEAFA